MKFIRVTGKGGDEYREYRRALKMAKKAIDTICELSDDMEDEYAEDEKKSSRDDWDYMSERRYRR